MPDKTTLETLEDKAVPLFGELHGTGSIDKSMLELSDTNRLTISPDQSQLLIAWNLLHNTLAAFENLTMPKTERVYDPDTGRWHTAAVRVDSWAWMVDFDFGIKSNQLTLGGYSRLQHLRQNAQMVPLSEGDDPPGFWQRFFGGGK